MVPNKTTLECSFQSIEYHIRVSKACFHLQNEKKSLNNALEAG